MASRGVLITTVVVLILVVAYAVMVLLPSKSSAGSKSGSAGEKAKKPKRRFRSIEDHPFPPISTMVGQPHQFKVIYPPGDGPRVQPIDVPEINGCLLGIKTSDNVVTDNGVRRIQDVAAISEWDAPENDKLKARNRKIPHLLHQTDLLDQVPDSTRDAIRTVRDHNMGYEHLFFSSLRMQEMLSSAERRKVVKEAPLGIRQLLGTAAFLLEHGGVHVDSVFATGKIPLAESIKDDDELVVAQLPNGTISPEFIAAAPNHKVIQKYYDYLAAAAADSSANIQPDVLLHKAFKEVTGDSLESTAPYNKNGIRVVVYESKPECLIGKIRDEVNKIYFYTRYPSYTWERSWYLEYVRQALNGVPKGEKLLEVEAP